MNSNPRNKPRRVLIASSHPLFGQGLRSLLKERRADDVVVVGVVTSLSEAVAALDRLSPDLVIVDYDDEMLNRDEFLARFVEGEKKLRVVLLSLQSGGEAIIYDRRTLAASQIDTWLEEWTYGEEGQGSRKGVSRIRRASGAEIGTTTQDAAFGVGRNRRTDMKHFIVAGILVLVSTALLILGLQYYPILPIKASEEAFVIDWLFDLEFKVIAFLFSLIVVLMLYAIVMFRRKPGDLTDAPHIEGNSRLEVIWTLAPLATVLVFAYLGGINLGQTVAAEPEELEVNVVGSQWSWRFEYPETGIISNELILPQGRQALLHLVSTDVIHSFWVPEFRVKQDALPGGDAFVRDLRVKPVELGEWKVRCAELCGLQHTTMEAPVRVLSQADFDAWVAEQSVGSDDPVARGQQVAEQFGCFACHSIDGTRLVGPSWQGLFMKEETLEDGSTVIADEAYLHESIVNPGAQIVQGYPNAMPPTGQSMSEEQIADVIEYIKSLQ